MSTAISEQRSSESLSVAAARRLRGQLAERNIKGSELARLTGLPQSTISRKLLGGTPFTLDEIQGICEVTGIDLGFILVGLAAGAVPTPPQDGERSPKLSPVSKREPLDYKVGDSAEEESNVHELFPRWQQPAADQPLRKTA